MKTLIIMLSLLACMAGCSPNPDQVTKLPTTLVIDDQNSALSSTLNSVALTAPRQPELVIRGTAQKLTFEWQVQNDTQFANLYMFDSTTLDEILIAGNIDATTTSHSIPSYTAMRAWHSELFRIELCSPLACVSSDRVNASSLAASTAHTIRPSVFINGEQFASSMASNDNASLIAVARPVEGSVQIYLHHQTKWTATEPMKIASGAGGLITAIASSGNGDTLAALLAKSHKGIAASIHVLIRLGEAWLEIDQLALPDQSVIDSNSTISLSADGNHMLVHAQNSTLSFYRTAGQWHGYDTLPTVSNDNYIALSASRDFSYRYGIQRQEQQFWLVAHRRTGSFQTLAWKEFHRIPVQGINANEEVMLKSSADGSALIIAGWENSESAGQRTPVMWRYDVHRPQPGANQSTTVNVRDSLRSSPTFDSNARLRFDASENLEHVALGWQSKHENDAQLSTFTFNAAQRRWQSNLELPADMSTLAKQGFADGVVLSGDGQSLFVKVPSGSASSTENRAGELLVFR